MSWGVVECIAEIICRCQMWSSDYFLWEKKYRLQQRCGQNKPEGPRAVFTESILKRGKRRNVILYVCKWMIFCMTIFYFLVCFYIVFILLPFSLFHFSTPFVITRGEDEITTERTQMCFFLLFESGQRKCLFFKRLICKSAEPHFYVYTYCC